MLQTSVDPSIQAGNIVQLLVKRPEVVAAIEAARKIASKELIDNPSKLAAVSSIDISVFGPELPGELKTCRLAIMRGGTKYHVEKHPNGIQYVYSLENEGSISVLRENKWECSQLSSTPSASLAERWHVVPMNHWHQPVPKDKDWTVLAFHSAEPGTLIDEYDFKDS